MNEEIWKPIPGFAGYEASDMGRVRSFWARRTGVSTLQARPCAILRGHIGDGYIRVMFRQSRKHHRVHHLVLLAFVGPRPEGLVSAHLDGNSLNNRLSNLAYVTQKENMAHRLLHGNSPKGTRNGRCKLTEAQVLAIHTAVASGASMHSQARKYGLSPTTVNDLISGKNWRHLHPTLSQEPELVETQDLKF